MLNKEKFITKLAEKGYTKKAAAEIYDDFLGTITESLVAGEGVSFHGFGSFTIRDRKGCERISPVDQSPVFVPAYKAVHFAPGRVLKRAVNGDTATSD